MTAISFVYTSIMATPFAAVVAGKMETARLLQHCACEESQPVCRMRQRAKMFMLRAWQHSSR